MRNSWWIGLLLFMMHMPSLRAQTWEIGIEGGLSYYVGDLNPTFHFREPHPAASLFGKRNFGKHWSVRAGFSYMRISADDSVGVYGFQNVRNLHFESDVFELHAALEFNFFPYRPGDPTTKRWTPYLFIGFGAFYFNPQTRLNGDVINLQPQGTEGQGTPSRPNSRPYSLFQPVMPFGFGFKFNIAERWSLGFEYGMRLVFTDYLDDVHNVYGDEGEIMALGGPVAVGVADQSVSNFDGISNTNYQRGMRYDNDWYSFIGISLLYNFKDPSACPGGYNGRRRPWR